MLPVPASTDAGFGDMMEVRPGSFLFRGSAAFCTIWKNRSAIRLCGRSGIATLSCHGFLLRIGILTIFSLTMGN